MEPDLEATGHQGFEPKASSVQNLKFCERLPIVALEFGQCPVAIRTQGGVCPITDPKATGVKHEEVFVTLALLQCFKPFRDLGFFREKFVRVRECEIVRL